MNCRHCDSPLSHIFADLGTAPLSNSYLNCEQLNRGEVFYPLLVWVCSECMLVQLDEFESAENIFNNEYAYFSSYSSSWLEHARSYSEMAIKRFNLNGDSLVVEVASNDGYLLKNFVKAEIPVLGIEPTSNTAEVAINQGIPTWVKFFGVETAEQMKSAGYSADLLLGNNVLAHVPDINDFVAGLSLVLKPGGVITMEFPHILNLINQNQFDTIYHEHFSYLSLIAVEKIFALQGLAIFDVEELSTHGGSLRIFAQHISGPYDVGSNLQAVRNKEVVAGLNQVSTYTNFQDKINKVKHSVLTFLLDAKKKGLTVAGYGAPAKGNTMLNFCGIRPDLIEFTVDISPHKQGTWLPGSRIPVFNPKKLREIKPDIVLILPWNLRDEVAASHGYIKEWGGRFAVCIPNIEYLP